MSRNKLLKISLFTIIIGTFLYYFLNNQSQFSKIAELKTWQIILIIIGQSMIIIGNIFILTALVKLVNKKISFIDSAKIIAYSSLINFFGFLQGGIGFRGIYLKRHFSVSFSKYFEITLAQYLILFLVTGLFLITGIGMTSGISQAVLILLSTLFFAIMIILILNRTKPTFYLNFVAYIKNIYTTFTMWPILGVIAATIIQLCGFLLAGSIELSAIGSNITLGGMLIYTGAAQFSIIIALTPGAIGIREGILLIVHNQMHLSAQEIIIAATIDRLIYFVTLVIFTPLSFGVKGINSSPRKLSPK